MPYSNTGGHEAANDEAFVRAAIPAGSLDALSLSYRAGNALPVSEFISYATAHGVAADSLHNAFHRMMAQQ